MHILDSKQKPNENKKEESREYIIKKPKIGLVPFNFPSQVL